MAKGMQLFSVSGDKEIDRFLKNLPIAFRKEALESAAKPAAIIIRDEARSLIKPKSTNGQSKAAFIRRNTRAVKSRNKRNPGYNIYVKGKDIPVNDRYWTIQGYAILYGEGSYHTNNRVTRKTKANRGNFQGFGNFIDIAGVKKGGIARRVMMANIQKISKSYLRSGR